MLVADFLSGRIQLGSEILHRGIPAPPAPLSPPSGVGGQELGPSEEQSFGQAEFLGDDGGGFATGKPVADSLAFEGQVELAAGSGRGFFDGIQGTRFTLPHRPKNRSNLTSALGDRGNHPAGAAVGFR